MVEDGLGRQRETGRKSMQWPWLLREPPWSRPTNQKVRRNGQRFGEVRRQKWVKEEDEGGDPIPSYEKRRKKIGVLNLRFSKLRLTVCNQPPISIGRLQLKCRKLAF